MAPKRNQSAYIMFQNHMREAFMEANPLMVRNSNQLTKCMNHFHPLC